MVGHPTSTVRQSMALHCSLAGQEDSPHQSLWKMLLRILSHIIEKHYYRWALLYNKQISVLLYEALCALCRYAIKRKTTNSFVLSTYQPFTKGCIMISNLFCCYHFFQPQVNVGSGWCQWNICRWTLSLFIRSFGSGIAPGSRNNLQKHQRHNVNLIFLAISWPRVSMSQH